jgi:hypothetical protein
MDYRITSSWRIMEMVKMSSLIMITKDIKSTTTIK